MKKVYAFIIIVFICLLIFIYYSNNALPQNQINNIPNEFGIYQALTDTTDIPNCFLDTLPLEDEPIFTDKDLISYDWNEHKLLIKHNKYIEELRKNHSTIANKPFVVVVNGERIYMGMSWSFASSAISPSLPIIDWSEFLYKENKNNTYTIQIYNNDIHGDYRNDKRIYDVLKELNKLK